jgi:hypothetical protein
LHLTAAIRGNATEPLHIHRLDVSPGSEEFIDEAAMGRCAAVYAIFAGKMLP